jgi:hypothetical protein
MRTRHMAEPQNTAQYNPTGWRFRLGLFFFVLGWVCPLFIPFVTRSDLPVEAKTLLSGFLLIGVPEIFSLISIVILGKPGFEYIKTKIFSFLRLVVPRGAVSRIRYRIGLFMLVLHALFAYLTFYTPDLIPGYSDDRLTMNLIADFLFLVTLFVLGGEFWDKLRALFLYDAKAHIATSPSKESA